MREKGLKAARSQAQKHCEDLPDFLIKKYFAPRVDTRQGEMPSRAPAEYRAQALSRAHRELGVCGGT